MFFHIGSRRTISDKKLIGIFNVSTLRMSEVNSRYLVDLNTYYKSVIIDEENEIYRSIVSPFTLLKRKNVSDDIVWRREDDD